MGSLDLTDLAQIVITDELFQRPQRATNFEAENYALHSLASQLTKSSQDLLQSLASVAVEICRAGSAGISIPETGSEGEEVFRWVALAGAYTHVEKTIPRHFTLCNICLERRTPQLYSYPGRYFEGLQYLQPPMVECLVLPIFVNASPLGTLWIVAHDDARQFDAEDLRIMGSLAQFTAVSLYQMQTHD
ncbi:MAG: GAF domain-containing protein, partial [Phormidesmis sp.]